MKPIYVITRAHNNLPHNRKQAELEKYLRGLIHISLTQEERRQLERDIDGIVQFLNLKYPKAAEYLISKDAGWIAVNAKGRDKSIYIVLEPIGESYTEHIQESKRVALPKSLSLMEYSQMLIRSFGDNAKVALCYFFASIFKDIIRGVTQSFPILYFYGAAHTGKTQLGNSLTSLFTSKPLAANLNNYTLAGLKEELIRVNTIVHLDEYKNSLDINKREFLKTFWDGVCGRFYNCGLVVSGQEMPTTDIALFNRLVFLTFSKSEFSDEEKRNYEALKSVEKYGLENLTEEILRIRFSFMFDFKSAWENTFADLSYNVCQHAVDERIIKNWATILAAFRTVQRHISMPFDYGEMLAIATKLCVEQNSKTKQNNELSGFWEIVDILVASSKIWIEADFRIKMGTGAGKPISIQESRTGLELDPSKKYLYINFARISQLYAKEGKDANGKTIPRETLKYYLEHSPEFCGTAKSVRFTLIETPQGYISASEETKKSKVTTAMIFDYDMICENYNINLDVTTGKIDEEDDGEKL